MNNFYRIVIFLILMVAVQLVKAQDELVLFEAESGVMGSDFDERVEGNVTYVTCKTNGVMQYPENENRIITYETTFPKAGVYDLYARVRIGSGSADDDSFFYGSIFGESNLTDANSWITLNNIFNIGFTENSDIVTAAGIASTMVWKWINISKCDKQETPTSFTVSDGALTQIIQIGAREDGVDFDKFAFGITGVSYTVADLNGEVVDVDPIEQVLLPMARDKWKYLGSCHSGSQSLGFANYWNQVTSENGSKWGSVERVKDVMNWNDMDAAYNLAKSNGFPFKFHTLIWGNQQPSWIENLSTAEQYAQIEEWFRAVANRYPDIDQIEVVNEPINDPPQGATNGNYIEALGGRGQTGYDWIIEAFRMAREIFPNSQLLINEYNIINNASSVTTYSTIINLLKNEGLIDGIGFQAHAFSTTANASVILRNLNELAKLELPIYATELDIDGPNDQTQLNEYKRIFPVIWEHKAIHGITLWGYRPGLWRNTAYLINSDGTERPAMQWLRQYIEGSLVSIEEIEMAPDIAVYPNPVSGNMVTFTGIEKINNITLFDVNGRMMKQMKNEDQPRLMMEMDVRPGIYVIQFQDEKKSYYRKVVVQ